MRMGKMIKAYRLSSNDGKVSKDPTSLGLRSIANEIGISHTALKALEQGKEPNIKTLKLIWAWLTYPEGDAS